MSRFPSTTKGLNRLERGDKINRCVYLIPKIYSRLPPFLEFNSVSGNCETTR
jgi:hypothetical protein